MKIKLPEIGKCQNSQGRDISNYQTFMGQGQQLSDSPAPRLKDCVRILHTGYYLPCKFALK